MDTDRKRGAAPASTAHDAVTRLPGESGQSLVEFALTFPIMMLVITGILYFGLALFQYLMLSEAAQIATRELMISRGSTLDPCATFSNALNTAAPNLTATNFTISLSLNGTAYTGTSCAGTATSGAPASMVLGSNAVTRVTYPARLILVKDVISPSFLLTATETEQIQ